MQTVVCRASQGFLSLLSIALPGFYRLSNGSTASALHGNSGWSVSPGPRRARPTAHAHSPGPTAHWPPHCPPHGPQPMAHGPGPRVTTRPTPLAQLMVQTHPKAHLGPAPLAWLMAQTHDDTAANTTSSSLGWRPWPAGPRLLGICGAQATAAPWPTGHAARSAARVKSRPIYSSIY